MTCVRSSLSFLRNGVNYFTPQYLPDKNQDRSIVDNITACCLQILSNYLVDLHVTVKTGTSIFTKRDQAKRNTELYQKFPTFKISYIFVTGVRGQGRAFVSYLSGVTAIPLVCPLNSKETFSILFERNHSAANFSNIL